MKETVQLMKKKKFINWFLETYRLKTPGTAKILKAVIAHEGLLRRTHFVENVRCLPSAVIISAKGAETVSYLCRINNVYYEDIDEFISLLEHDPPEELFVWLSFNREFLCSMCDIVLGVKPDVDDKIFYHRVVKDLERELNFKVRDIAERKEKLVSEIDQALVKGDKDRFMALSALFKEMFE
ncbi:MAG: YpiB family protein [Firmicutes bacterium]|nr:YpiB family protein [Bacillota bacterium]